MGATAHDFLADAKNVRLSEPKEIPEAMLAALRVLYALHFHIRAAYLAQLSRPAQADSLLIALDSDSDLARVVWESAAVIQDTLLSSLPVDITRLERDASPLAHFFAHATPFYERGLGARLTSPTS